MPENDPRSDGQAIPVVAPATPKRTGCHRSAITAKPEARLNGNSPVGRRVRDLFKALMTRLGDPVDVVIVADVLALVELKVAAEVARARLLEGKNQTSNECVRLENLVRRAEGRVGLEPGAAAKTDPGSWQDLFVDDEQSADGTAV